MDEFNELDKELAQLKEELAGHDDEWTRQFHFPAAGDYWRRRLEEEKTLWEKKISARTEEKKALEAMINQQKSQLEQYNQRVKEIEKKFEDDSKRWAERLKAKETDLFLEKNRLLWEEKVKQANEENQKLLEKASELNAKIGDMKDEQYKDKKKLGDIFDQERAVYEERIKTYTDQIDVLKKRITELDENIEHRVTQMQKINDFYDAKLTESEKNAAELLLAKDSIAKEKEELQQNLDRINKEAKKDRERAKQSTSHINQAYVQSLHSYLGPLFGFVESIASGKLASSSWKMVKELVQRVENETELFMTHTGVEFSYNTLYSVAVMLTDKEFTFWEDISTNNSIRMKALKRKTFKKEILTNKPQAVIVSIKYLNIAKKIQRLWPFLPIIVFGNIEHKKSEKLKARGFKIISPPYMTSEVLNIINQTANQSVAWPEFWNEIKMKRSYIKPALTLAVVVALGLAGYFISVNYLVPTVPKAITFSTPYSKPTNLAYDGEYLWVCDWFGQGVYQHKPDDTLELERIFHFPEKHLTSIAWVGGYLWSADPFQKKIFKHNMDGQLSVLASYAIKNAAPSGLAGDGKVLWSCDSAQARIYRHRLDKKLSIEAKYNSPGPSPSGLYYDGEKLWSIDSITNKIYCHKPDYKLTIEAVYLPRGYEQKGFNLSGIAFDKQKDEIWICSEKMGKVLKYRRSELKKIK